MDTTRTYTQAEVDSLNQLIDRLLAEKAVLLKELQKAHQIIKELWRMLKKHNVSNSDPDWPYMRILEREDVIAKAEKGETPCHKPQS